MANLFKSCAALTCIALASCAAQPPIVPSTTTAATASANSAAASPSVPAKQEYVDALLAYEPLRRCEPTPRQLKLADLAATAIEMGDDNSGSLTIGAEQYRAGISGRLGVRSWRATSARASGNMAATAYDQISSDNALGTGAAQVAAAAGHPGALERIANLMDQTIARYPQGGTTMPSERYKRLIELLWSFEVAGPPARDYLARYCAALDRYWWRGAAVGPPCLAGEWQLRREAEGVRK
jgi:hypothetical protein